MRKANDEVFHKVGPGPLMVLIIICNYFYGTGYHQPLYTLWQRRKCTLICTPEKKIASSFLQTCHTNKYFCGII